MGTGTVSVPCVKNKEQEAVHEQHHYCITKNRRCEKNQENTDAAWIDSIIPCATGASALMEMNKQSGGLVISGYKLPDMYYTELADMLPSFYEILLIGSANVVSSAQSGSWQSQCRFGFMNWLTPWKCR